MNKKFTKLIAALALLVFMTPSLAGWGQTRESYSVSYGYSDLGSMLDGSYDDASSYWKVPATFGNNATISIPITYQPESNITLTFNIATFGSGTNPSSSNTTITAVGTESNSNWTGSGVTVYPSSSSFVNGVMTITKPENPTTLGGLTVTMGVNTGVKIFRLKTITVAYTYSTGGGQQPTTYTVTFDAGDGTFVGNTDFPNASNTVEAGTYTLPSATPATGYTFDGWAIGEDTYQGGASYTVSGDADFIASYTENTTPTGGETATLNIEAYADANNWVSGTKYATATISPVTFTANGGGNTGKYYTSGEEWRFYQTENASITISVAEGYTLVSVTPTYSVTNSGVLKNGNTTISSGTTVSVSGTSVTFTVGNSGSATNGQVKFTNIDVVYVSDGSTQTTSDLTITNQSTDLTFDLYNNTTAQVISYTTSSTGAITITPAESDYFSYVHDAAAKTITVTPTAVTPSAQTVTINQAADDDYYAGTATFTVSVANSDPNQPGTQDNPYNVADLDADNLPTGTVYVRGIVSHFYAQDIVSDGENYRYFISDDGTTESTQVRVYKGNGLNNVAFANADDLLVGDIVVVCGSLGIYQGEIQFSAGNYIVSLERPQNTEPSVTVTPNTISAPFAGADGTLDITYENITEIISFDYYFCDANGNKLEDTDPDYPGDWIYAEINDENEAYTLSYIIDANDGAARTAYMKVYTYDDEVEEVSAIVTVSQAQYVVDYATLPFEFNNGKDAIEETNGLTQSGLGNDYADENAKLKFDSTDDYVILKINERPGTLTFKIKNNSFSGGTFKVQTSEDGVTYTDLKTYTEITGTQNEEFTDLGENVRYIKWVYTNKSSGNVGLGHIALAEYVAPALVASIIVNPDEVELDAEEHDGTLDLAYENLTITDMTDFDIQFCDANGEELSEEPDWIEVLVAEQDPAIGEGYVVSYYMVENEGTDARTAYFKVYAMDDETNLVYSNLVTITQAAPVVPPTPSNWVLTDLADLTEDDVFVIVGDNGDTYAMPVDGGGQNDAPVAVAVTVVEGTLSAEPAANLQWNISITDYGYTFYPNGETETWLYCINNNNGVRVGTGDAKHFTLVEGYLTTTETTDQRYIGIYNSQDWRCYTNTTGNIAGQTFSFYKKVVEPVTETYELTIDGYSTSTTGWHLIASPVATPITPTADNGFITDPYGDEIPEEASENLYDLYKFDQSAEKEWVNYRKHQQYFSIESGKGYLYASKNGTTLTFTGTPYNGDGVVELDYTQEADFAGWNLVGNPFNAEVSVNQDFYVMNGTGSEIIAAGANRTTVAPMEGIFVKATEPGLMVTFTIPEGAANNNSQSSLSINLTNTSSRSASVIDRAIVRFNGNTLPKFQLFENSTKLYIPQGTEDYAIVSSEAQGEMPVNFRANENGTYTLTVNPENVDMNYLHLIDNMTGADVDLLATPSYSFNATTNDYESRFRLVFAAANNEDGASTGSAAFAFMSDGNWIINNAGEATLQVIDINGRILSSERVNGSVSKTIYATPGVYMLRLINGENVMVQKIVVR